MCLFVQGTLTLKPLVPATAGSASAPEVTHPALLLFQSIVQYRPGMHFLEMEEDTQLCWSLDRSLQDRRSEGRDGFIKESLKS